MCLVSVFYYFRFYSYLAISAAIATEADFMLIPEEPVPVDWQEHLCKKLIQVSELFRFNLSTVLSFTLVWLNIRIYSICFFYT